MTDLPFSQRQGVRPRSISDDFPLGAMAALSYLVEDLVEKQYVSSWHDMLRTIARVGGLVSFAHPEDTDREGFVALLSLLHWWQRLDYCEYVYSRLLQPAGTYYSESGDPEEAEWVETVGISEVRAFYEGGIGDVLLQHNLGFAFTQGQFRRRGRAQTQKSIEWAGTVLSQSRMKPVLVHFRKARRSFDKRPDPDSENCIKDAVCALEAAIEVLTDKPASKDFDRVMRQLAGNDPQQIPGPICEAMIKLHAYRGNARGAAHAALQGSRADALEAELTLSLVASYVTYLADLFPGEDEIPF